MFVEAIRPSSCDRGRFGGVLVVPVAGTCTLDRIQEAAELGRSRRARGKLVLVL